MSSMYTGDVEIKLQAFKISALEGSEWSAAWSNHFSQQEAYSTHWIWDWEGLTAWHAGKKEKCPFWKLCPSCPAQDHSLRLRYSDLLNITKVQCWHCYLYTHMCVLGMSASKVINSKAIDCTA
jgi:hypothetical protein